MIDHNDDSDIGLDNGLDIGLDDQIGLLRQQSSSHFWVSIVFLVLLIIAFAMGVMALANAHANTAAISIIKPEHRAQLFNRKMTTAKAKAEQQYASYLNKMNDDAILAVTDTYETLHQLSIESERQYAQLLTTYQAMVYDAASRIKGSGEWFYYYEQDIIRLVSAANNRQRALKQYISQD